MRWTTLTATSISDRANAPAKYAYASYTCHTPPTSEPASLTSARRPSNGSIVTLPQARRPRQDYPARRKCDRHGRPGPFAHRAQGLRRQWYVSHLGKSREGTSEAWKNSFREIGDADLRLLKLLRYADGSTEADRGSSPVPARSAARLPRGQRFRRPECPISRVGERSNQLSFRNVPANGAFELIAQHFRSPASTVPGSLMPALDLNEQEIDLLTMYMLRFGGGACRTSFCQRTRQGDASSSRVPDRAGGALTICSSCHGASGKGQGSPAPPNPSITNPDFLAIASDDYLNATIARGSRAADARLGRRREG